MLIQERKTRQENEALKKQVYFVTKRNYFSVTTDIQVYVQFMPSSLIILFSTSLKSYLQITEHMEKSTTNHEIRLVGRNTPFTSLSPFKYRRPDQDNGDIGISLRLGYVIFSLTI